MGTGEFSWLITIIPVTMCRSSHKRYSVKNVFLEISQNSQENTCFPVNFAKFLRTAFLQNTSWRLLLNVKKTCFKISQPYHQCLREYRFTVNIGIYKGCFNKTFLLKDETMLVKIFYTSHLHVQAFKVKHWKRWNI